ncbi:helix-turn-helix domain-containing protein [Nonomuraea sp. NPDC049400]|uniref:helix-turn-helix domain-containing protein n=1 Tax=Nonomuraea sp. NPDC049400 TaxID=3364352 RepID=UPI0037B60932
MRSAVRLAAGDGFRLDAVTCVDDHRGWSAAEVGSRHRLVLVRRGRFRRRADGRTAVIDPTMAYLSVPGAEEHFAHPAGGDVCTSVSLSPTLWRTLAGDGPPPARPTLYVDARMDLAHRRFLAAARGGDAAFELAESLLSLLGAALGQLTPAPTPATSGGGAGTTAVPASAPAPAAAGTGGTEVRAPAAAGTGGTEVRAPGAGAVEASTRAGGPADGREARGSARVPAFGSARVPTFGARVAEGASGQERNVKARAVVRTGTAIADAAREAIAADHPAAGGLLSLAEFLAVSPYQLSRAFTRELGISLTHYRNRVRVGRALDRLEEGEPSLAGLAADLGFADQAHLTRTIRRHVGHTPTALRRLLASRAP